MPATRSSNTDPLRAGSITWDKSLKRTPGQPKSNCETHVTERLRNSTLFPVSFPPEKGKTLVAFGLFSLSLTWSLTVLAVVHERVPDRTVRPLPDIFFDHFPTYDWALEACEDIIITAEWATIFMIVMHKHRFIILRRCFIIRALLYFMRSITMFVTQVPIASTTYFCSPKANTTSPALIAQRVLSMWSGFGLSINGKQTFCGDYIYSGHTVVLTMTYLVMREYSPWRRPWCVWVSSVLCCTGVLMLLLSRAHYSVDVIVAYFATTRVFWIYHTMANNTALKVPSNNNFLSRIWWFSVFSYFEKNVVGVVPRKYEWPLPWPRKFSRYIRMSQHSEI